MGGSYLSEMKDLRDKETEMEMIRNFFLEKDKDLLEKNNKMRGILYDDAKVMRPTLHSSHPSLLDMGRGLRAESHHVPNLGSGPQLQLQPGVRARVHFVQVAMDWQARMTNIFFSVIEESPAWRSGLRPGDSILEINEWRISSMSRPEVALSLLQAGANSLRLGVMRGQENGTQNYVGVF